MPGISQRETVNDALMNAGIRRSALVERFGVTAYADVLAFLNRDVFPDILTKLRTRLERIRSRGFDRGPFTTQRYRDMLTVVGRSIVRGYGDAVANLSAELQQFARQEAAWQVRAMSAEVAEAGFALDFTFPSQETLRSIVTAHPMQGRKLRGWFSDLGNDTRRRIDRTLAIGLAQGETTDQLVRRIRGTSALRFSDGVLATSRRNVVSIVRTAVTHTSNQAREAAFRANSDVVKAVMWVSTLDNTTCIICASLDGKTFEVGKGERPPAHPG